MPMHLWLNFPTTIELKFSWKWVELEQIDITYLLMNIIIIWKSRHKFSITRLNWNFVIFFAKKWTVKINKRQSTDNAHLKKRQECIRRDLFTRRIETLLRGGVGISECARHYSRNKISPRWKAGSMLPLSKRQELIDDIEPLDNIHVYSGRKTAR